MKKPRVRKRDPEAWLRRQAMDELRQRQRKDVAELAAAEPYLTHVQIAHRVGCSADMVSHVRGRQPKSRIERFTTPTSWLEQPPARVRAQRQAEGIEP
jgi:hypothetical protein